MQRSENRFFASLPLFFSLMGGVMFAVILLVVIFAQPWFEQHYRNLSLLSNLWLLPAALAGVGFLFFLCARAKPTAGSERKTLWFTRGVFALTLLAQFLVARACWYKMGWDISVVYTTAEELARGQALSNPSYFSLCPNNAPLTILQFLPMWVAVRIGLAVPFVVLPYIDAVLLNLAAYTGVRCVQTLTASRAARGFATAVSVCWIALSPYILYPYTDSFAILFPVLALYVWLKVKHPALKWFLISLLCFFGASIKPTVLIVLIALVMLGACRFLARRDYSRQAWLRALAAAAALMIGMLPGRLFQNLSTEYLAGTPTPQGQLSETHYLMLGMNGETYGGHSTGDVDFSTSFETLDSRRKANLERAWERVSSRSLMENAKFFSVKLYKAYADGSFAAHNSFLELEVPRRTDPLSRFLRSLYHEDGACVPFLQTAAQGLWLMILFLCGLACLRHRGQLPVAALALTLLGVTAYLLLFEVWPRYLFLYAPFYAILAALALDRPLSFKR